MQPTGHAEATAQLEAELVPFLATARAILRRLAPRVHPDLDSEGLRLLLSIERFCDLTGRGARGGELVEGMGVHKSSVSRGVTHLEGLGLIVRRPDPSDARASLLRLTPMGVDALGRGRAERHREISAALAGWSEEEIRDATALLRRLGEALG